jgi:hypothetical protein
MISFYFAAFAAAKLCETFGRNLEVLPLVFHTIYDILKVRNIGG